jgi:N-acetylglucosamine-6-phosphate deacetylase
MFIKNCNIIYLDKIENGSILVEDGKIKEINPINSNYDDILDANGLYISPGFIDVHIHGAGGYDTMDGTVEAINTIAKTIVKHGTTSFTPTTMTVSIKDINKSMKVIKKLKEEGSEGTNVLGKEI